MSPPNPPSQKSSAKASRKPSPQLRPNAQGPFEVVDPKWLASALALTVLAAVICAWLAVCLLFYQGEWQLVLHPSHTVDKTPASVGLGFESVRFNATETGQPRLTGWWMPAQAGGAASGDTASPAKAPPDSLSFAAVPKYAGFTVLYLHGGSGSLSDTVPALARLHRAGINVFAIDYRGFGQSDLADHPAEARMAEDAAAGLDYLTTTRHIPLQRIIPYGEGLGAPLAAGLALGHPEIPAVILDNPDPDPTATAIAQRPSHLIPVRLLFREHFEIASPLAALHTPKLMIAGGPDSSNGAAVIASLQVLFRRAASPSLTVTLPAVKYEDDYQAALTRFLDEYLPVPSTR